MFWTWNKFVIDSGISSLYDLSTIPGTFKVFALVNYSRFLSIRRLDKDKIRRD
jgi:hypothetical protein